MFVFGVTLTGFTVGRQEGSTGSCKFILGPNIWWCSVISSMQETSGVLLGSWSPTFLAPGTIFVKDNFFTDWGGAWFCDDSDTLLLLCSFIVAVQLFSGICLFVTPWTAAHQASLSSIISQSLLKLVPIVGDATQPSHPRFPPSPPALSLSQHQGL